MGEFSNRSGSIYNEDSSFGLTDDLTHCCASCSRLNISTSKFLAHESRNPTQTPYTYDSIGLGSTELGFLDEIYSRRLSCNFCRLVWKATRWENGQGIGLDGLDKDGLRVLCQMDWQLDGRKTRGPGAPTAPQGQLITLEPLTRRMRLYSKEGTFPDTYIVLHSAHAGDMPCPTFLGRSVGRQQADVARMNQWIETCESHHGLACQSLYGNQPATGIPDSVRMIDVDQMCLVPGSTDMRYITLSYVWGRAPMLVLKLATYESLHKPRGLEAVFSSMTRTIQDAIRLVKLLGLRYIWVDSLCIIQDSQEDWQQNAPMMDKIYGNSLMTICGATGNDSRAGLPGALPDSRNFVQQVERHKGLDLVIVRHVESHIQDTTWNSRAWTFQERLLSKRCLIFVGGRVFFQCRQATWSEELDCEGEIPSWNLDMIRSPLTVFNENPLRRYSTCVQLYSSRKMAFLKDKMVAFEGIGNILRVPLEATLHFGLPDSYFDWAMLWEMTQEEERINTGYGEKDLFPSWSWCGWDGGVEWRLATTSGILLNMHDWLKEHTWIVWYKGTYNSHELLWNGPAEVTKSTRWDGYALHSDRGLYGRSRTSNIAMEVSNYECLPLQPHREGCLHFWTYSAFFMLSRKNMSDATFKPTLNSGLHRFGIEDRKGDWCGTIILGAEWFNHVGGLFEFIAISEAKDFELEEYDSWTYYVPQEREQAEWYLYYALLIRWNDQGTVAERVGLAKIFRGAFQDGSCEPGMRWKEITLG